MYVRSVWAVFIYSTGETHPSRGTPFPHMYIRVTNIWGGFKESRARTKFVPKVLKPSSLGPVCPQKKGRQGRREQRHRVLAQGAVGRKANLESKKNFKSRKSQACPIKRGLSFSPRNPSHALPHHQVRSFGFCSACMAGNSVVGETHPRCRYRKLKTSPSTFYPTLQHSQHRQRSGPSSSKADVSSR